MITIGPFVFQSKNMVSLTNRIRLRALRILQSSSISVKVAGTRFRAPIIDGVYCHPAEPWMADLQKGLLRGQTGSFIDVGMNVGQTLLAVKAIDRNRSYFGFDPNPLCFAYCERLVRLNQLPFVSLAPIGLSGGSGIARLQSYDHSATDPSASVVPNFRPGAGENVRLVPVFRFAEVRKDLPIGEIGILKVDVEGAEWDVLQGMEEALVAARPWIVIEILPCYSQNGPRFERQQLIEAMLDRLNYQIMRVGKDADGHLKNLVPLDRISVHDQVDLSDYVLCHRQDVDRLVFHVAANSKT